MWFNCHRRVTWRPCDFLQVPIRLSRLSWLLEARMELGWAPIFRSHSAYDCDHKLLTFLCCSSLWGQEELVKLATVVAMAVTV